MKSGVTLTTARLVLRHWQDRDLNALHRLNSDDQVMRFFPFRRDRKQTAELLDRIRKTLADDGISWAAVTDRKTDEIVGFSGLCRVRFDAPFTPAVEIGWRLLPEHWGKGYATEAANELLRHGFLDLGLRKIVSFAVPANTASTKVMERIGMRARPEFNFDMPGIADDYSHLRPHEFYQVSRAAWRTGN